MGSLKSLALLALLFTFSFAVFADTSNDATHAKNDVNPSEATDAIEPQQRGRGGCRYGCCGSYAFGRCSACCSLSQAQAQAEAVEAAEAIETEAVDANAVEPQQRGRGGCRYGCCGSYAFGRCSACCSLSQAQAEAEAEETVEAVEPQKRLGGGCRYGCCGPWRYGRCIYCCRSPQAEAEVVEPQRVRSCRYGCCGSYAFGQCSACCSKKMATEEEKKKDEAKP
ncbi:hypothetical protein EUTSA_v10017768mg [Eutrema salsugineum]|uniref:Uncharacterized protein n=1 Tax=Eutrema salsugineum TaxID=72664 RepID=V4LQG3_EUTSA|nr:late embryogenesis abundant protein M17 [Eutrema salsugineum]ESQ52845.1 hypothetical protein EUTSA_v10017768mg [Eutrema salsugineum]